MAIDVKKLTHVAIISLFVGSTSNATAASDDPRLFAAPTLPVPSIEETHTKSTTTITTTQSPAAIATTTQSPAIATTIQAHAITPIAESESVALAATKLKAEQGNAAAQRTLGIAYYKGEGVTKNYSEAIAWWRKAVKQNDLIAQWSLGLAYYEGKGVARNYKQAVYWWRQAAVQGNAEAQSNLGLAYYLGLSMPENRVIAYMWLSIAENSNAADSDSIVQFRNELEKSMTPKQIADAKELAQTWKKGEPDPGLNDAFAQKTNPSARRVLSRNIRDIAKKTGVDTASVSVQTGTLHDEPMPALKTIDLDKTAESIVNGSKKAWKSVVEYVKKHTD
ncbi:MAG: tetratricopeptide repeat protein [Pseudomonadota bacterium]